MALTASIDVDSVNAMVGAIRKARLVVADGNVPTPTLERIVRLCDSYDVQFAFEPTTDHRYHTAPDCVPYCVCARAYVRACSRLDTFPRTDTDPDPAPAPDPRPYVFAS
jgi:hypothetical protein